ncbi:phage tail sheath subtilisin-like domain-containing protein [Streptomyces verrucosisporus]|uniref:phage tail sheath subtilisin-like domain-containing protein n=1 Tax=Streptomyces verrucosisporus TaxID=1695161 RepID=UPI003FD7E88A
MRQRPGPGGHINPPVFPLTGGVDGDPPGPRDIIGDEAGKTGLHALRDVDDVSLLSLPELAAYDSTDDMITVISAAQALCRERRILLLADAPGFWADVDSARAGLSAFDPVRDGQTALYFPQVQMIDPLTGRMRSFPPSGAIAGVCARTDAERGVWKAPAGTAARLAGVRSLSVRLTDRENALLNPLGVNCLRTLPAVGSVVWGARTLQGADALDSEWKYVSVRRLTCTSRRACTADCSGWCSNPTASSWPGRRGPPAALRPRRAPGRNPLPGAAGTRSRRVRIGTRPPRRRPPPPPGTWAPPPHPTPRCPCGPVPPAPRRHVTPHAPPGGAGPARRSGPYTFGSAGWRSAPRPRPRIPPARTGRSGRRGPHPR